MQNQNQAKLSEAESQHSAEPELAELVVRSLFKHSAAIALALDTPSSAKAILERLEGDLTKLTQQIQLSEQSIDYATIRGGLALVFDCPELEEKGPFEHSSFQKLVEKLPNSIEVLFSSPTLSKILGAAVAEPVVFKNFSQTDAPRLEAISTQVSRLVLSSDSELNFNHFLCQSLFENFVDTLSSPSPQSYIRAMKLSSVVLPDNLETRTAATNVIATQIRVQCPIPLELWNMLNPQTHEFIASALSAESIISWASSQIKQLRQESEACLSQCNDLTQHLSDGVQPNSSEPNSVTDSLKLAIKRSFDDTCQHLSAFSAVFTSLFVSKCKFLATDSISEKLRPRSKSSLAESSSKPDDYRINRFHEFAQAKTLKDVASLLNTVFSVFSHTESELTVPAGLVLSIHNLREDLGYDFNSEIQDFYEIGLLKCFSKAMSRFDFESADHIRKIFPPDDKQSNTLKRFVIDEFIADHQHQIIEQLQLGSHRLKQIIDHIKNSQQSSLGNDLEKAIDNFENAMRFFIVRSTINRGDPGLIVAVVPLLSALVGFDSTVSQAVQGGTQTLALFSGCKAAARILERFQGSPASRAALITLATKLEPEFIPIVASFITSSNRALAIALKSLAAGDIIISDILGRYNSALAAERLYIASENFAHALPAPLTSYMYGTMPIKKLGAYEETANPETESRVISAKNLGLQIAKLREEMLTPTSGLPHILPGDFQVLELWAVGLIGDQMSPKRQQVFDNFFELIVKKEVDFPPELRPLILEALVNYGHKTIHRFSEHPESVSNIEFIDAAKYLLTGFMMATREGETNHRPTLAIHLNKIFMDPRSEILFGKELSRSVSQEFLAFSQLSIILNGDPNTMLKEFINLPTIKEFLAKLQLLKANREE